MTFIIDANVAIKWFIHEEQRDHALHILKYKLDLHAPDFLATEIGNIAWKKHSRNEVDTSLATSIVAALPEYIPQFTPTIDLNERALELALEIDHPIYDCIYLACAEMHNGTVITADKRFFNKLQSTAYKDQIRILGDPDLMLPLYISIEKIEEIIEASEFLTIVSDFVREQMGAGMELGIINTEKLAPAYNSPAYKRLEELVKLLTHAEMRDIAALGILGLNDASTSEQWGNAQDQAGFLLKYIQSNSNDDSLVHICSMTYFVKNGLANLRSPQ